jgi:uncharacterized repeat protein (TIGR03806 family)
MRIPNLLPAAGWLMTALLLSYHASARPGLDKPEAFGAFLNGAFPSKTPGSRVGSGAWSVQNAFPRLTFPEPVRIVEHPRANQLVVVSKTGQIWMFNNSPEAHGKQLLLDLSTRTNYPDVGEGGVTGFAFHPDFGDAGSPNRGYFYVAYRYTPGQSGITTPEQQGYNRISRFTLRAGSSEADPSSERVLINQYDRQQWHIGGDMFFGKDGFLYIGVGDEGHPYSRNDSTQRIDGGLWSGILRIDVNQDLSRGSPIRRQPREASEINSAADSQVHARPGSWPATLSQGYSIPSDNPFRDPLGSQLEEFFAIGLRHPWTISQDPATGEIWCGDVGEDGREQIGIVRKGSNHQWGFREGLDTDGPISLPNPLIGKSTPPILDYSHMVGKAVIGAGVYRGERFPQLRGKFLFSDFMEGQLWAIDATETGPIAMRDNNNLPGGVQFITQLPAGFSAGINAYRLTRDGRVLMAKSAGGAQDGGTIVSLEQDAHQTPQPPLLLSQTGIFKKIGPHLKPAAGLIPFSLVVPFWSDHAIKSRWIGIPNNGSYNTPAEKVQITKDGDLLFPVGTVAIKHFELIVTQRKPSVTKRIETRVLVHGTDGWYGVTYRWNAAGTDARLIDEGQLRTVKIRTKSGGSTTQTWQYPSRTQCMSCHTPLAGGTIGLMTRQLNREQFYPRTGRNANQLATLSNLGVFSSGIRRAEAAKLVTLKATDDRSASLSQRARSYLDANCSYCHQPGGVRANFDARYTTPFARSGILNGTLVEPLGIKGGAIVVPGKVSKSILYHRVSSAGKSMSMPPIGKGSVDRVGVKVLADWIAGLSPGSAKSEEMMKDPLEGRVVPRLADVWASVSAEDGVGAPGARDFSSWIHGFSNMADASPSGDPDSDGVSNLLEYVLNGSPDAADASILPSCKVTPTHVVFSFNQREISAHQTVQVFEYSLTPGDWKALSITEPTAPEVRFGPVFSGVRAADIYIPRPPAPEDHMFGRLKVTSASPY